MSDINYGNVYVTAEQLAGNFWTTQDRKRRGVNVMTLSDLLSISGEAKSGRFIPGTIQQNLFTLSIEERIEIYRRCAPVYGVVSGRAKRIAGLKWQVKKVTKNEDRTETYLRMALELWKEWGEAAKDDRGLLVKAAMIRMRCYSYIATTLVEITPNMANFEGCLSRWKQRLKMTYDDKSTEIEDWLDQPNAQDTFKEFIQKSVLDLMIHGAGAWYKERAELTNKITNFYVLPGGTVLPFRSTFVGGANAFAQILNGLPPKIYFTDEISYLTYAPISTLSYGTVPLEALTNKVAEYLLFDQQAAMKADGTTAPEKLIVMNDYFPYGEESIQKDMPVPLTQQEQRRIETLANEPRRNAIRVLTGYGQGQPVVVDLSRADTFQQQSERQDKILREVAIVYNMSNMEINLTGSGDTSGRSTSETQEDIEQEKGWTPVAVMIEDRLNHDILSEAWGTEYEIECDKGLSEEEQVNLERLKMQTGTYAVNELRKGRGDEPYPEEIYNRPPGQGQPQPSPDGSEGNPLSVKMTGARR